MSQTSLIIILVAVAGVLVAGYFVYQLATIATDLYQLKVEMKKETEDRLSEMMKQVESRIVERSKWIRDNLREENQRSFAQLRSDLEDAINESEQHTQLLRQELAAVDKRLARLTVDVKPAGPAGTKEDPEPAKPGSVDGDNVEYLEDPEIPSGTVKDMNRRRG